MKCLICGRLLDQSNDPLSQNCGGDCWGCTGEIEAEGNFSLSADQVRREQTLGLRPQKSVDSTANALAKPGEEDRRQSQSEFGQRGRAAVERSEQAGDWVTADQVLAKLEAKVAAAHARLRLISD